MKFEKVSWLLNHCTLFCISKSLLMRKGQTPPDHMAPFEVMWSGCHVLIGRWEREERRPQTGEPSATCQQTEEASRAGSREGCGQKTWDMNKNIGAKEQKMKGRKREREKEKERHGVYCRHLLFILRSQSLQVQGKRDVSTPISSSWGRKGKTGPWFEVQGLSYCSGCVNNSHMLSYYCTSVGKGCPQMLFHGEIMES